MTNKRIEIAQRVGLGTFMVIWFLGPFYFFLLVDTGIDAAGAYLIGALSVIIFLGIAAWLIDGEKEKES